MESLLRYSGSFPPVPPAPRLLQDLVVEPTPARQAPFTTNLRAHQSTGPPIYFSPRPTGGDGRGRGGRDGPTQEDGHGRFSSGGEGDDGNNGGGGGYGRDEESRAQRHSNLGLSGAVANLLLNRIRFLEQREAPADTPRIRQQPLSLPTPVKEVDGSIRTTSVFRWFRQVAKAVDELGLDRSYVLFQLSNERQLPAQWKEIFSGASDLESAFIHLKQRIPPLASCFPELVGKLTGQPATDGTNEEVIERCGAHLSSIADLLTLFPNRDINREQLLACLASVGSTEQLQAQMVSTIRKFDQHHALAPDDPLHLSYLEQLRCWLEGERSIRVDIIASIKIGKFANESVSTVTSFVSKIEGPGKGRIQPSKKGKPAQQMSREEEQLLAEAEEGQSDAELGGDVSGVLEGEEHEDGGAEDEEVTDESDEDGFDQEHEDGGIESSEEEEDRNRDDGEDNMSCPSQSWWQPTQSCVICHQIPSHAPYMCGRLEDIKHKTLCLPSSVCSRCCNYIGNSNPHSEYCHLRSIKDQDGRKRWRSYLCGCNSGVHYRLCSLC